MNILMLAQSVEAAEKGLTFLERVNAGGVPLICLVVAALCGALFYWQLKKNGQLYKDQLKEVRDSAAARDLLLREMLDRDREAGDVTRDAATAIKDSGEATRDLIREIDTLKERIRELTSRVETLQGIVSRGAGPG